MPTKERWPLVMTSVSGIAPEIWVRFKEEAARRGLTLRLAIEQAIRDFAERMKTGGNQEINDPPVDYYFDFQPSYASGLFRLHTSGSKTHPLEMHYEVLDLLREIARTSGYKQNVVVLNAMMWWTMDKHHGSS